MPKGITPGRCPETYILAERHRTQLESAVLQIAVTLCVLPCCARQPGGRFRLFQRIAVDDLDFDAVRHGAPIDFRYAAEYRDKYPPARMRT